MNNRTNIQKCFYEYFNKQTNRLLTQIDRDPQSPSYGCFDRNYWHYKIRDFPSSILQQGVFVLEELRRNEIFDNSISSNKAKELSDAAVVAFSNQIYSNGSVDEYYPFEDSFPAAAFGSYAIFKTIINWKNEKLHISEKINWNSLKKLVNRLKRRSENKASNQNAISLASLSFASLIDELNDESFNLEKIADNFFLLQHEEGWFEEYGGSDFGYLSVTIDALIDYYDVTKDQRAINAIDKAVDFLINCIGADGELPWTLNSRNTDYLLPYGLIRYSERSGKCSWLIEKIFKNVNTDKHWISSTDDRYNMHYIFSSLVRSLPYIKFMKSIEEPNFKDDLWMPGCGFWIKRDNVKKITIFVGLLKGGLVRIHSQNKRTVTNNGWRLIKNDKIFTTNFMHDHLIINKKNNCVSVSGLVTKCNFIKSTFLKHFIIRILSFIFGPKLSNLLKEKMIFSKQFLKAPKFQRKIEIFDETLNIKDEFFSTFDIDLIESPRQNTRHVASADSYHIEESNYLFNEKELFKIKSKVKFIKELNFSLKENYEVSKQ